ncbi:GtrA family protein [Buttiauxella sp. S04-F03]|uniref:GtrA family protein n=1 Tax=Buttiauxella sp. S04-F03 TaxID=2904525 RepID=UPI001E3420CA|nr:GtrA family protein [Buttiauxella sp. S04-F03]MCE0810903.1 GtrA family protein [Buttiauxella sp. S04-F03]
MNRLSSIYYSQAIRYCVVGGVNTIATAAVILSLTTLGTGLYLSNLSGYFAGILFSFVLNTYFTFSSKPSLPRLIKFITCCAICYSINLIAMNATMLLNIDNEYLIQIIGMFFYTACGFIINKIWVMK